jgi:dynein heavy chain
MIFHIFLSQSDFKFIQLCKDVDKDKIPRATIQKLQKYIADPEFKPELLESISKACVTLCSWVIALDTYSHVFKQVAAVLIYIYIYIYGVGKVEPKRKKLEEAEIQLQQAEAALQTKQVPFFINESSPCYYFINDSSPY